MQADAAEVGLAVERLPAGALWSGAGLGDYQLTAQAMSVAAGGGVRVGLEDGSGSTAGAPSWPPTPGSSSASTGSWSCTTHPDDPGQLRARLATPA